MHARQLHRPRLVQRVRARARAGLVPRVRVRAVRPPVAGVRDGDRDGDGDGHGAGGGDVVCGRAGEVRWL